MQYAVNSFMEGHTDTLFHTSPFITIVWDESTYISANKELVLYARTVGEGKVSLHFLKIIEVKEVDADSLTTTILTFLGTKNTNMVSFRFQIWWSQCNGTDVATRLKCLNPFMVSVHCIAHRLALACSQAVDSVPYVLHYQRVLCSVYTYFSSSWWSSVAI